MGVAAGAEAGLHPAKVDAAGAVVHPVDVDALRQLHTVHHPRAGRQDEALGCRLALTHPGDPRGHGQRIGGAVVRTLGAEGAPGQRRRVTDGSGADLVGGQLVALGDGAGAAVRGPATSAPVG